jgi:hypothetical protein
MDFKEYLILLAEVVIALWVVGWSLGFAVAAVVGAFHQARHCDKCTAQELDTYDGGTTRSDEGETGVQPGGDEGATVYRSG